MHTDNLPDWQHDHSFGQGKIKTGERRTLMVVIVTAIMMLVEIVAGGIYGSMALLADGLHMASHAVALSVSLLAYVAARRLAYDRRFSFGTGKINSLAGFGSAILLFGFALLMVVESATRLLNPVAISFNQAIAVAVLGLLVNGFCAWLLGLNPDDHDHHHGHDHNLKAAYLHVLADALTSLLAIIALLAGKYFGAGWLDPVMGIVGAVLIVSWSLGLLRETGRVLLDHQADSALLTPVRSVIEQSGTDRVADLHVWGIGPGIHAATLTVVSDAPQPPDHYRSLLPGACNIVHATVEVQRCPGH